VLFLFSQISDCELTLKEICFIVFPEIFIENFETHLFKSTYLSSSREEEDCGDGISETVGWYMKLINIHPIA
jgi:hypothetical protein